MRSRIVFISMAACILALVATTVAALPYPGQNSGRAFSAAPLRPEAAAALRARGQKLPSPFPNAANQGRKFAPGGDLVGQLVTPSEQRVLVLFAQFTDAPPGGPAARLSLATYFDTMLFGETYNPPEYGKYAALNPPTDRTLLNYYRAVSYGKVDVVTLNKPSKLRWRQAGHPYAYYCNNDNGMGAYPNNAQGLVEDMVRAVDSAVDFSKYARDGEVPNLFVVFAGTGAEWSGDPSLIWSHSWSLDSSTPLPEGGIVVDGVRVNNYAVMPEVGGDLTAYTGAASGPFPPTVGVYAHEYGHVLGLPDQYDYGYESEGTSIYSLMAGGSWNQYPRGAIFSGNSPAFLDAWSRYRLGFVTPINVTSEQRAVLPPAETSDVVYRMDVPASGGKEYFLFENRQQIGFDQGLQVYRDPAVGQAVRGLAIYHVDDVVLNRNYWRCNEAENWKEWRSAGWQQAWTGESHYGISIIQADGRWDLERGLYTAFISDLYPGDWGVTSFGNFTSPNSSAYYFWAGNAPKFGYSGVTAENIKETGDTITATLKYVLPR